MNPHRWFEIPVMGICLTLSLTTMVLNQRSPVAQALLRGERITGLLIGSDYEDNTRHSDTMMVISYNPNTRFLDVLSIPRDTMITIPGLPNVRRVNETFALEYKRSNHNFVSASLAVKSVVESILSSGTAHNFDIPYYFTIDYGGFRSLIDAMGGVTVRVVEPMHYDDNWGHLHIDFDPGVYHMDGHTALTYVRFRGKTADQGRVMRQQIFVKEVLNRLKSPIVLFNLPHALHSLLSGIHSNFSLWDMAAVLTEGRRMRWTHLRLTALPGSTYGNLWKFNPEKTHYVVDMIESSTAPKKPLPGHPITVDIWNGTGQSNVARSLVQRLRSRGYDVVNYGTYPLQTRTLVLDRMGQVEAAQAVAASLDVVSPEVLSRVDPGRQVDVSVIIGADYPVDGTKRKL